MKKTLAFLLAIAMLAGLSVTAFAADAVAKYPVTAISDDAYLWDDDENGVDLTESADMIPYGKTAYFPLIGSPSSGADKYVYEKAAAGNMKISKKWEEGSSYVDGISVVKKKITPDSRSDSMVVSGQNYIYFLAVEIEKSSSTTSREVYGEITIKQKGNKDYAEVDEISVDISIEIGYDSASKKGSDGEIPKTPATFKDGDGFDYDSEFEFSFEADSDSYFVVNTNGQGKIVLGFDTDYDDKIGDKYPDADLYFFNGNYATFNRTGTLYLGSEDDDLYVYSIASDGSISRVDAEYDDSEEAYVIKTRTLGRYVLSSEKLKTKSSSSSSSSESSSSSASVSTVVRPSSSAATTITSTPTYTPPVSSRPASTPPPVASSTVESSEPEEEEEEEEENPEEEDFEEEEEEKEEEVVDVVVDDEVDDKPEKKKGLPGWAWALIIAGLVAIPLAIGIILFIQTRPTKREFFDNDDYDDDDDE